MSQTVCRESGCLETDFIRGTAFALSFYCCNLCKLFLRWLVGGLCLSFFFLVDSKNSGWNALSIKSACGFAF